MSSYLWGMLAVIRIAKIRLKLLATELAAQVSIRWVKEEHGEGRHSAPFCLGHTYQLTVWGSCPMLPEVRE